MHVYSVLPPPALEAIRSAVGLTVAWQLSGLACDASDKLQTHSDTYISLLIQYTLTSICMYIIVRPYIYIAFSTVCHNMSYVHICTVIFIETHVLSIFNP